MQSVPSPSTGPTAPVRPVAAGGWRRAVVGFAVGALAGALVALVLPREEGPRRTITATDRPRPLRDDG